MINSAKLETKKSVKKGLNLRQQEEIVGTIMASIPFLGFLLFTLFPMALSLVVSFFELHSYDITRMTFCGWENYKWVFTSKWVKLAVGNTLEYCISVPINVILAVFLANLFSKDFFGSKFGSIIAYLPTVCSVVAITLAFQWIFEANYGVVNSVIGALGGTKINFMGDSRYFMPAVIIISIWMKGTNILQLQAAMSNVDDSLREAARLDGASSSQVFFNVTLPCISPTVFYIFITWLIAALQEMTVMQLLSNNGYGPDFKATTITFFIYRIGITQNATDGFGRASALSWVFAICVMILSKILFKINDKVVSYD